MKICSQNGVEICTNHDLDEEEIVDEWTAFSAVQLGYSAPTVDTLARMEKEKLIKKSGPANRRTQPNVSLKKAAVKNNINLTIPSGYTTPQRAKPQSHDVDSSPVIFSPDSYSPAIITPSRKQAQGANSGKVLCEFQSNSETDWTGSKDGFTPSVELLPTGADTLLTPQHYMYEPVHVTRSVLCDRVEQIGNQLIAKNNLTEASPIDQPAVEEEVVIGRITCDAEDTKLTANSVVLVGAVEREEVPVSLQHLPNYALFPGQVVAMKALNQTGKHLFPKELFCNITPPAPEQPINFNSEQGPLQVAIASGPFTHSDAMTYEPLHALVQYAKQHNPHILILIGPFLDGNHQSVQNGVLDVTFETFFQKLVQEVLIPLNGLKTHVVLVASEKDAHHHAVYPTPPYSTIKRSPPITNLTMAPDPCLLSVNGLVIGVTATDVLMHLGRCEVASQGTDRLGRLASHVLHQATFYPLYPPPLQMSMHLELWEKFAQLPVKPHVLVLPSDLRCFIKEVDGSIVVNPERLAKGVGSGSFARLEVHLPSSDNPFPTCVKGQVLKI